jgi:putative addiction module CopG family antidote
MKVSLPPALEQFVVTKVKSGLYVNASEVVRESLQLLKERDEIRARWRAPFEQSGTESQGGHPVTGRKAPAPRPRIKRRATRLP